jgi:hypothetical protein
MPKLQAGFSVLLVGTVVWPRTVAFDVPQFEVDCTVTVVVVVTPVGEVCEAVFVEVEVTGAIVPHAIILPPSVVRFCNAIPVYSDMPGKMSWEGPTVNVPKLETDVPTKIPKPDDSR